MNGGSALEMSEMLLKSVIWIQAGESCSVKHFPTGDQAKLCSIYINLALSKPRQGLAAQVPPDFSAG